MHVDPLILERHPDDRTGFLSHPSLTPPSPSFTVEELFEPTRIWSQDRGPTVLLYGAVGTGKSTVIRKLVLDWCAGKTLTHFKLLIPFSCEDLAQLTK